MHRPSRSLKRKAYPMLRDSASGPEIKFPGLISAGFSSGKRPNRPSGRPKARRRAEFHDFLTRIRPKSGPEAQSLARKRKLRNIGYPQAWRNHKSHQSDNARNSWGFRDISRCGRPPRKVSQRSCRTFAETNRTRPLATNKNGQQFRSVGGSRPPDIPGWGSAAPQNHPRGGCGGAAAPHPGGVAGGSPPRSEK
jgi:hypothetical protein